MDVCDVVETMGSENDRILSLICGERKMIVAVDVLKVAWLNVTARVCPALHIDYVLVSCLRKVTFMLTMQSMKVDNHKIIEKFSA